MEKGNSNRVEAHGKSQSYYHTLYRTVHRKEHGEIECSSLNDSVQFKGSENISKYINIRVHNYYIKENNCIAETIKNKFIFFIMVEIKN